jgi:lysophospholipase L1-like esterase
MSYPGLGAHARKGNAPRARALFFADLQEAARQHHFTWLDGVEVFAGSAGTLKTDQLHFNADGHRLMAAAIHTAVLQTLPTGAAR